MSRKGSPADSTDLFLDAVCNTFGSIVFLAILVVLLIGHRVRTTESQSRSSPTQVQIVQLRNEIQVLQSQIRRLQRVLAEDDLTKKTPTSDPVLQQLIRQRDELRQVHDRLKDQIAQVRDQLKQLRHTSESLRTQIAQVHEELRQARQKLSQEVEKARRSWGLPQLQYSNLREAAFMIRNNTLYAVHRPGRTSNLKYESSLRLSNECVRRTSGNVVYLEPVPGQGIKITGDLQSLQAVKKKFKGFNPQTEHFTFFVWADSFQHWQKVREVVEELGFHYALFPMLPEDKVSVGRSGPRLVQ